MATTQTRHYYDEEGLNQTVTDTTTCAIYWYYDWKTSLGRDPTLILARLA